MKDKLFQVLLFCSASVILLVMAGVLYALFTESFPVFSQLGFFRFFASPDIFPFVMGTFSIAGLTLLISIPLSLSVALFTGIYYNQTIVARWINNLLTISSKVPSILWGIAGYSLIRKSGIAPASLVLAAMIVPHASVLIASLIKQIPNPIREGAYCLGATSAEVIRKIILPMAGRHILAVYLLTFGRLLGETIIIVLLAGNTITSAMLNQFEENPASGTIYALAAGLFLITAAVNFGARYMIRRAEL